MTPSYYIIAGEASGDLHGSNLIKALRVDNENCKIRFWGGDLMEEASNSEPIKHYKDLAFMGFVEVIKHLPDIYSNLRFCKKDINNYKPDALILIDYPGFNLRIAKWAHQKGINVQYYISPKVWAWNTSRVHKIKRIIDNMYVILPFEKEFYAGYNYNVTYVGNPLLDEINNFIPDKNFRLNHKLGNNKIIAVLPGSRIQELRNSLPIMMQMLDRFPDYHFCIAKVPSIDSQYYINFINQSIDSNRYSFIHNDTYNLLDNASLAIVTSGTATLETALFNVPQVVCYRTNKISYMIGKKLIKVPYISLVNLILEREAIEELIQDDFNATLLETALLKLLENEFLINMQENYKKLHQILGTEGAALLVARSVKASIL